MTELNASRAVQHVNVFSGQHLIGTWNPAAGKVYYAYSDWLGTKRYEADGAGTYVNSWTSLPFGDNETALGTGTDATEHHFTGKEHDAESGLDYFKARYYQSQTGRWLLPDWSETPVPVPYASFTNPQSLNLYTYVGNNPVNAVDADGHVESQNSTNDPVGTSNWQHMKNCYEGSSEPDCLSDQVIPGIMDGAIPVHASEELLAYQEQVADSNKQAAQSLAAQVPDEVKKAIMASVNASDSPTADDTQGGFHEESGVAGTDGSGGLVISPDKPGPYSNPDVQDHAQTTHHAVDEIQRNNMASITVMWHIHPSGQTRTHLFGSKDGSQGPSDQDRRAWVPGPITLVVGARDRKVYFYDGSKEVLQMSLKKFMGGQ